jgi:hypothetical protein
MISICEIFILEVFASVTSDLFTLLKVHVLRIVKQRVPSISQVGFVSSDRQRWGLNSSEKETSDSSHLERDAMSLGAYFPMFCRQCDRLQHQYISDVTA